MDGKRTFDSIRRHLESYLTPDHIINEKFSSQNFWMEMERKRYKQMQEKKRLDNEELE
jgi:hypothetical protein